MTNYLTRARQVIGSEDDDIDELGSNEATPEPEDYLQNFVRCVSMKRVKTSITDTQYILPCRDQNEQSFTSYMYIHKTRVKIMPSFQIAVQVDSITSFTILGETRINITCDDKVVPRGSSH